MASSNPSPLLICHFYTKEWKTKQRLKTQMPEFRVALPQNQRLGTTVTLAAGQRHRLALFQPDHTANTK